MTIHILGCMCTGNLLSRANLCLPRSVRSVQGFISPASRQILVVSDDADDLLAQLEAYTPPVSTVDVLKQTARQQK
jgi:predicted Rossmann-fold nucleotide-binding protein